MSRTRRTRLVRDLDSELPKWALRRDHNGNTTREKARDPVYRARCAVRLAAESRRLKAAL